MSKLIATYAAGMLAVFTEDRAGLRQRALLDIGDNVPTPEQMAGLSGQLSDQWGWLNPIAKGGRPVPSLEPVQRRTRDDHSDPKPKVRTEMVLSHLAAHPDQQFSGRELVEGFGLEPTPERLGRWSHTFGALLKAEQVIAQLVVNKSGGTVVRQYLYQHKPQ